MEDKWWEGIGQDVFSTFFYHGTNDEGKKRFEEQKYLGHEYYDGIGLWISSDLHHACGFGRHIYRISFVVLNESLMDITHGDDGIFYPDKVMLSDAFYINDNMYDFEWNELVRHQLDYL